MRSFDRRIEGPRGLLLVAGLLLGVNSAKGQDQPDWHRWRGPGNNGISSEAGWNPKALAGSPRIRWTVELGEGYSSVSIQGERLYTMGNQDSQDIVYCLDPATGKEIWRQAYRCKAGSYPGPRATPTIDGQSVYTVSRNGEVFCLDAETGKERWRRDIAQEDRAKAPRWGQAVSPWVEGDLLILSGGVSGLALNKKTGQSVWGGSPGIGNYASPVVYETNGKRYAAIFGETAIYGVDIKTGRPAWSFEWVTKYHINAADAVIVDDRIFISSGYNKGCALLDVSGKAAKAVWQNTRMRNQFSSSVFLSGYLYGIDGNVGKGVLRCLDVRTGEETWGQNLGFGSLMSADGKLIILNEKGKLFIADADPGEYREHSSGTVLSGKPKCWTPPVLCRGLIYCRNSAGRMVCVDVSG